MTFFGLAHLDLFLWPFVGRRDAARTLALGVILLSIAILLALGSLTSSVLALTAAVLGIATLIRPALGLAILGIAIPFGSLQEIALGSASIGAAEGLTAWVLLAWVARAVAYRQIPSMRRRYWIPVTLWLGAALLSVTGAVSWSHSLKELGKWMEFAGLIVCTTTLAGERERSWIVVASLVGSIAAALLGWYQFFFRVGPEGFVLFGRFMRAYGTFRQPNPYAGYLGLMLPVGLSIVIGCWPRTGSPLRGLWLVACAAVGVIGPAIAMSWSRGSWFGVAAGALVVLLGRGRRFALSVVLVVVALAGLAFVAGADLQIPPAFSTRLTDFTEYFTWGDVSNIKPNPANFAVVERQAHWQAAVRMFADRPWLGVGIGNYEAVYDMYRAPRWTDPLGHAHNYYLNVAAESGVIGLAAYVTFWTTIVVISWRCVRSEGGARRAVALGILGAIVHLSVHNFFDDLFVQGIYLQVALWIGIVFSMTRLNGGDARCDF